MVVELASEAEDMAVTDESVAIAAVFVGAGRTEASLCDSILSKCATTDGNSSGESDDPLGKTGLAAPVSMTPAFFRSK